MRSLLSSLFLVPFLGAVLVTCCRENPDEPTAVEDEGQRFLLCGEIADDRREEVIDAGAVQLKRQGPVLERTSKRADGPVRFGILTGVEEWNEPNRHNLIELQRWFAEQQVEALILAGGVGPERESCLNVLKQLASSEVPVLPLIGASADFSGYRRAVAQAQKQHKNIIDLSTARVVDWGPVTLVSLPGYHNPFYLGHRRGGCAYREEDVSALGEAIEDAEGPFLLVAAAPPRGRGPGAIDFARGGVNIGDPALTKMIDARSVPFGVFGHVYEAGGRATSDPAGRHPVRPGQWSKTLYLNPGAAEAVPYDLSGGGRSRGMGAILEIGDDGARFQVRQLERLDPLQPARAGAPSADADASPTGDGGAE